MTKMRRKIVSLSVKDLVGFWGDVEEVDEVEVVVVVLAVESKGACSDGSGGAGVCE